jgi:hypothetical protein
MDRAPLPLPLPLPLPRPGEAIVTTAIAGALGLTTWACVPFLAFPSYVAEVFRIVEVADAAASDLAVPLAPLAFHWLRYGLVTAKNSPERRVAPTASASLDIGIRTFVYAPVVTGLCTVSYTLFGGAGVFAVFYYPVGVIAGIAYWVPAAVLALLTYGLPLRAATGAMDATYPDVVDRALVRTHARLAIGAALALVVGGVGFARSTLDRAHATNAVATFLLFGLLALAVPVGVALRAQRRLAARKAWPTGDLHLVPIAEQAAERLARVPILGDGTAPTHALVRVAAVESYRIAATPEEPLALVTVATETPAKAR